MVEVADGSSSNAYKPEVDWTKISGNKGYRIVDARRMTGANRKSIRLLFVVERSLIPVM